MLLDVFGSLKKTIIIKAKRVDASSPIVSGFDVAQSWRLEEGRAPTGRPEIDAPKPVVIFFFFHIDISIYRKCQVYFSSSLTIFLILRLTLPYRYLSRQISNEKKKKKKKIKVEGKEGEEEVEEKEEEEEEEEEATEEEPWWLHIPKGLPTAFFLTTPAPFFFLISISHRIFVNTYNSINDYIVSKLNYKW